MTQFHFVTIGVALAVATTPFASASAQSSSAEIETAAAAGDASADSDDKKMVCRKIRKTGTRVAEKVCRTRAQWIAIQEAARESANTIQGSGAVNTTPTVGG